MTSSRLLAGENMSKTVTITGEVIDTACYVGMDREGGEHEMCVIACIKSGLPVAILDDKTNIVFFVAKAGHPAEPANEMLAKYASQKVKATGMVTTKGDVSFIMLEKVEKNEPSFACLTGATEDRLLRLVLRSP